MPLGLLSWGQRGEKLALTDRLTLEQYVPDHAEQKPEHRSDCWRSLVAVVGMQGEVLERQVQNSAGSKQDDEG